MIKNSELEGDLKIEHIIPLRIKSSRIIIGFVFSVATLFVFSLM